MSNNLEEEIELIKGRTETKWCSRRKISALIIPEDTYMLHELELNQGRIFSFRPPKKYKIPMKKQSTAACQEILSQIWAENRIQIKDQGVRAQTKKQRLEQLQEAKRNLAEQLLADNFKINLIQGQTGLTRQQIYALKYRLKYRGSALKYRPGKCSKIKEEQLDWLRAEMLSGNLTGNTAPEILEKLKRQFHRSGPLTKTSSFYYTLRRKLNWRYSLPIAQKEKMNDPETISKRLEYSRWAVPLIHQGRNFVYIDETSFQVRDRTRKTWQPRGRKLIVSEQNKTKSYTLIGALDSTGFLGYMIAEKGAQQEQFMGFIAELIKHLDQKGELRNSVFIMDNATIHNSILIEKTILKHIPHLFLAPYSPQMNPIEKLWFILKSRVSKKRIRDLNSLLRIIFTTAQSIDAETCSKIVRFSYLWFSPALTQSPFLEKPYPDSYTFSFEPSN
ncbi:hypothetical protein ABPG72_015119 [Tetrahymena utriculariae]